MLITFLILVIVGVLGLTILVVDVRRLRRGKLAAAKKQLERQSGVTDTLAAYARNDEIVRYDCGHEYAKSFGFDFYGERRGVIGEHAEKREKCGDCLLAEIGPRLIRCCRCGCAIMPGQAVAAYDDDGSFKKAWSTVMPGGGCVIGCMRMDCCPSGGFFVGHWSSQGVRSAFGGHMNAIALVMATGKPVVVNIQDGEAEVTILRADDDGKKENESK